MLNPVWDPTAPGLAIFVGTNPVVSHGYGTALPDPIRYLREYRAAGGKVWVLDPRRTETAALADVHVPVRPGADVAVLAALANALLDDGADERELRDHCDATEVAALRAALAAFTIERRGTCADVEPALLEQLVADVRAHPGRIAMHCGTGVTMARDGVLAEWLRWVVLIASGSLDRASGHALPPRRRSTVSGGARAAPAGPSRPRRPSRPELPRVLGQIAAVALVDEIEAGNIRALFVTGGNPLTAFPQPDRLRCRAAARSTCSRSSTSPTTRSPRSRRTCCPRPVSSNGPTSRWPSSPRCAPDCRRRGRSSSRAPTADRSGGCSPRSNRAMGRETPGGANPDDLTDEDYLRGVLAHRAARRRRRVRRRTARHRHPRRVRLGPHRPAPRRPLVDRARTAPRAPRRVRRSGARRVRARAAPGDGVEQLDRVRRERERAGRAHEPGARPWRARSCSRRITGASRHRSSPTPPCAPDVVSMTHGHADANPGDLTSSDVAVDPLTAMPLVSGLGLEVRLRASPEE